MKRKPSHKQGARLGQHFLTKPNIARAVAEAAGIEAGDTVLEIGPGKGILTREILALGANVTAIEKDTEMVSILNAVFAEEIKDGRLTILAADARDVLSGKKSFLKHPYKVAANIPYYITGELLRLCLTAKQPPISLAFLVQKEVADRIVGKSERGQGKQPKKESILSLSVSVYGTPKYIKTVSRGNFNPPPNVDSAILAVTNISKKNFQEISEEQFFKVVKAGFAQKRKTLGGNLKKVFGERVLEVLSKLGVDKQKRAEDIPLGAWIDIAKEI